MMSLMSRGSWMAGTRRRRAFVLLFTAMLGNSVAPAVTTDTLEGIGSVMRLSPNTVPSRRPFSGLAHRTKLSLRGGLSDHFVTRMLFGGAIEIRFPSTLEDVSDIRPVPDHQEVWVDSESECSVIVEILERDEKVEDPGIAEHVFSDLATENNATDVEIIAQRRLKEGEVSNLMENLMCPKSWVSAWLLSGAQSVAKFRETSRDTILLHLLVVRLPNVDTDLVITLNQPISIDASELRGDLAGKLVSVGFEQGQALLEQVAKSLRVRNWSLFGEPTL